MCPRDGSGWHAPASSAAGRTSTRRSSSSEIAEGNAAEALRHAEAAKARGFEDVVAAVGARGGSPDPSHNVARTLAHWPKDVAALEYFLGEARGWVFLVSTAGKVRVFELARFPTDGRSIAMTSRNRRMPCSKA